MKRVETKAHACAARVTAFCMVAVLSCMGVKPASAQGGEKDSTSVVGSEVGRRWVERSIAPGFQHLAQQSRNLQQHFEQGCIEADPAWLHKTSSGFESVVKAWSGVAFLRFGPLVEDNRYERLSFWPDPRGVMLRQVSGTLQQYQGEEPAVPIGQSSVAVQGLPALEYVLYRDKGVLNHSLSADERRPLCRYAADLTKNIASVAGELSEAWLLPDGEYAQRFVKPGANNPVYRSNQEILSEGVKALSTGLQFVRDIQLAPPLMGSETKVAVKKAPYWRSGLTGPAIAASLTGMRTFVLAPDLLPADQEWIVEQIEAELGRAAQQANALPLADEAVPSPSLRQEWMLLGRIVDNAKDLTDADLALALGVNVGFNALDGD